MAKKVEQLPQLDPFMGYTVHALNGEYKGESNGVSFSSSRDKGSWGRIEPLPKGADQEDQLERIEHLRWFLNGEAQRFLIGYDNPEKKTGPQFEYRKPYRLVPDKEPAAKKDKPASEATGSGEQGPPAAAELAGAPA